MERFPILGEFQYFRTERAKSCTLIHQWANKNIFYMFHFNYGLLSFKYLGIINCKIYRKNCFTRQFSHRNCWSIMPQQLPEHSPWSYADEKSTQPIFIQSRESARTFCFSPVYILIGKLLISELLTDSILCCSHDHLPSSWQKNHEHARWTWVQRALFATFYMCNSVRVALLKRIPVVDVTYITDDTAFHSIRSQNHFWQRSPACTDARNL